MAGTPIPVSIASDMTLPFVPPTITVHDYVPIPPGPASPFCMSIESPVAVMWGPGYALFQNKLTTTVIHQGLPFALDGHDCGYMIPHITVPVNNARLPIIVMFSGRKMVFAASTVKANGAAVGCSTLLLYPMMCCGFPVTHPTGFPVANSLNTVRVGLTTGDIVAGLFTIFLTMVADALTYQRPSAPDLKEVLWKVLLGDEPKNWAIKQGAGVLAGVARIVATGEGSIQVQAGSSYVGVTLGYTRGKDGSNTFSAGGQVGIATPYAGVGGQAGVQYSRSATGEATTTTSHGGAVGGAMGPLASGGASTNTSTASTTDASGKTTETTTTSDQKVGVVPLHGSSSASTTTESPGSPPVRSGYRGGHSQGKPWGQPL